jgi:hypothetical protein
MESATPTAESKRDVFSNSNRRRGNRHQLSIPATLVAPGEPSAAVTVIELSVGGIGIHCEASLKLDSIYLVNSFDTLIPPGMQVRIVSQRAVDQGGFEIGAKAL